MVKSEKGNYIFKDEIVPTNEVENYLKKKD
jgi:hypothetical protein